MEPLLPYYPAALLTAAFHEVGHAAVGTFFGAKVTRIWITPWATGGCEFKTLPISLPARAAISAAGPVAGLTTISCCLIGINRIPNDKNELTMKFANITAGFLVAKELCNLLPEKGLDGHECWWYLKTRVYKGVHENLLEPKNSRLTSVTVAGVINAGCILYFQQWLWREGN